MTTPSQQKRALVFVVALIPPSSRKTSATVEGGSKKGRFYRPLPTRFRRDGFEYRQIAREGDAAIYEQGWTGCAEPSVCYEAILIRRRNGFQIGEKFVEPYEVYPNSEAWGVDGFTFADRNKAFDKFFEISLEMKRKEVIGMKKSFRAYLGSGHYLKKEDLSDPVDTELLWVKEETVTTPGKDTTTRLVAYFEGLSKGLVLNTANCETLAEMTGTNDPNEWKDVAVQLYVDPDVTYGGKKIGGIRIRKPAPVSVPVPKLKVKAPQQPC